MQRMTIILGAVLAGQLVLAGVLHMGDADSAHVGTASAPLAQFDSESINAIRIDGPGDASLKVERGDEGWRLPASDGYPAAQRSVDRLLQGLHGFDEPLPVARSASARDRFRVGTDNYERRVRLVSDGKTVVTLFFGSSAGTGRVYARAKGQDMIHEVEFPLWHAATDVAKWRDDSLATVDPASVEQASFADFLLRRGDDGKSWRVLSGEQTLRTADTGAAAQLIQRMAQPKIESVSKQPPPDGEPTLRYTLSTSSGDEVSMDYYPANDGKAMLYVAGKPWRYTVADKQLAQIRQATPKTLVAGKSGGDGNASKGDGKANAS